MQFRSYHPKTDAYHGPPKIGELGTEAILYMKIIFGQRFAAWIRACLPCTAKRRRIRGMHRIVRVFLLYLHPDKRQ